MNLDYNSEDNPEESPEDWVPIAKGGPAEIRALAEILESAGIAPKVTTVPGG